MTMIMKIAIMIIIRIIIRNKWYHEHEGENEFGIQLTIDKGPFPFTKNSGFQKIQ